jgi:hypothetical protein
VTVEVIGGHAEVLGVKVEGMGRYAQDLGVSVVGRGAHAQALGVKAEVIQRWSPHVRWRAAHRTMPPGRCPTTISDDARANAWARP